jgi:hypothetical protein
MFLVKAEVRPDAGPANYQLFKSESVRVERSEIDAQNCGPLPERSVILCDIDGSPRKSLAVGHGLYHYCAIYIMNENGKTVDAVYPGPQPEPYNAFART